MPKLALQENKLQDAFLRVAGQSKRYSDISMIKIALAAGVTPQAIYKKYYKNVHEITETLEKTVLDDFRARLFTAQAEDELLSPFVLLAQDIFPSLYEERLKFQVFFRQDIFPHLFDSLSLLLDEWLSPYLKTPITGVHLPPDVLLRAETQFLLSVFSMWLLEKQPIPLSLFQAEFLELVRVTHLAETIDPKYHLVKKKVKGKKQTLPIQPTAAKVSGSKEAAEIEIGVLLKRKK